MTRTALQCPCCGDSLLADDHDGGCPQRLEPPFNHPAADSVDGTGDEPDRRDDEVPDDAA